MNIKPKKSLGQNFLHDKNISKKIVSALQIKSGDFVVEIGAGTGFLTEDLLSEDVHLLAYEIDQRAVSVLKEKFSGKQNIEIIYQDFLKVDLPEIVKKNGVDSIKVVGNLPYYILSQILFKILENHKCISKAVIMLQKEVAQRLNAAQKTKDYGILTEAVNLIGNAKILFDVSPHCFFPQPEVTSSVVEITFRNDTLSREKYIKIMELVRASFSQRRKKLKNSLSSYINKYKETNANNEIAEETMISKENTSTISKVESLALSQGLDFFSKRAEELSPEDFLLLYDLFFPRNTC